MARKSTSSTLLIVIGVCCIVVITINYASFHVVDFDNNKRDPYNLIRTAPDFVSSDHDIPKQLGGTPKTKRVLSDDYDVPKLILDVPDKKEALHKIAGLNCDKYGGPSAKKAEEMVYWSDIPSDAMYSSPFKSTDTKYLTFEPDKAGWNNARMSFETIVGIAHAMGRTLVIPPERPIPLLWAKGQKKSSFSFHDFYHLESLSVEHPGLNIITMEEFLSREALNGKLKSKNNPEQNPRVKFPPQNRTDWHEDDDTHLQSLWDYLRDVGHSRLWDPNKCVAVFPATTDPKKIEELNDMMEGIVSERDGRKFPKPRDFIDKPVPVDAPAVERLREALAKRENICVYDTDMQAEPLVHLKHIPGTDWRMLTHFYGFLFFEDWRQDLWTKRFVRDHLRYSDEVACTAAKIVDAVRERARARNPKSNPSGNFDTFHIRRGDFAQFYDMVFVDANQIYENSKKELEPGSTIFIATDERNKNFFDPLAKKYDLCFLSDFKHLFPTLNKNYYGVVDQLVAARGRVFFGVMYSTFSGYINRLRGYYNVKEKQDGYKTGVIPSYYYANIQNKYDMQYYYPVTLPFFYREFPAAWRDIDKGIDELVEAPI